MLVFQQLFTFVKARSSIKYGDETSSTKDGFGRVSY